MSAQGRVSRRAESALLAPGDAKASLQTGHGKMVQLTALSDMLILRGQLAGITQR